MQSSPSVTASSRRGFVLPIALAVLVMLTLAVYLLVDRTVTERTTSRSLLQRKQVDMAARSAGDIVLSMMAQDPAFDPVLVESWTFPIGSDADADIVDGPPLIELTLLAPAGFGEPGLLPGLASENGRLNLNTLATSDLDDEDANFLLVSATAGRIDDTLADLILDFIDDDSESRPLGDESGLSGTPIRNQPLDSLDDLLMIPGLTPDLLYGEDANRNNLLDATEDDADQSAPPDNADGILDLGLADVLTVSGRESNLTTDGLPKLNLNSDNLEQLAADLQAYAFTAPQIDYLMLARKVGIETGSAGRSSDETDSESGGGPPGDDPFGGGLGGMFSVTDLEPLRLQPDGDGGGESSGRGGGGRGEDAGSGERGGGERGGGERGGGGGGRSGGTGADGGGLDDGDPADGGQPQARLTSLGDVLSPIADEENTPSPFVDDPDALRLLFAVAALTDEPTVAGRLDINAAGVDVLAGLPGWDAALAESITSQAGSWTSIADLFLDGVLTQDQFREAVPLLTTSSRTYRFQAVAFIRGGPAVRYEFVVDAADPSQPLVLQMHNLTQLSLSIDRAIFETGGD